ncbi:MAG: hypothetical protein ABWY25_00530 [Paenisporosarcina sp.]
MSDRLKTFQNNNITAGDAPNEYNILALKRYDGSILLYSPYGPVELWVQGLSPEDSFVGSTTPVTVHGVFPLNTRIRVQDSQLVDHFPPTDWGLTEFKFDASEFALGEYSVFVESGETVDGPRSLSVIEPLVLNSITPNTAEMGPGPLTITLNGSGFYSGCQLRIDSSIRTPLTVVSPTQATFDFTAYANDVGDVGTHNLSVSSNNMGTGSYSNVLPFIVTPQPPVLTSISPATLVTSTPGITNTITLTGTGFAQNSFVIFLDPDGIAEDYVVGGVVRVSNTTLTIQWWNSEAEAYNVVVQNGTSEGSPRSNSLPFTITWGPDTFYIDHLTPSSGTMGVPVSITATGNRFTATTVLDVYHGQIGHVEFQGTYVSATELLLPSWTPNIPISDTFWWKAIEPSLSQSTPTVPWNATF